MLRHQGAAALQKASFRGPLSSSEIFQRILLARPSSYVGRLVRPGEYPLRAPSDSLIRSVWCCRCFSTTCRNGIADQIDQDAVKLKKKAKRKAAWKRNQKAPAFIDRLLLDVSSGTGGDGCVSFQREKYQQYGPPSGGHGGDGGDVYIEVSAGLTSLARIGGGHVVDPGEAQDALTDMDGGGGSAAPSASAMMRAQDGENGQGSFLSGKKARDRIIRVPVGTVVKVKVMRPSYLAAAKAKTQGEEFEGKHEEAQQEADEGDVVDPRIERERYEDEIIVNAIKRMPRKYRPKSPIRVLTSTSMSHTVVEEVEPFEEEAQAALDEEYSEDMQDSEEEEGFNRIKDSEVELEQRDRRNTFWRHHPRGNVNTEADEEAEYASARFREAELRAGQLLVKRRQGRLQSHFDAIHASKGVSAGAPDARGHDDSSWDYVLDLTEPTSSVESSTKGDANAAEARRPPPLLIAQGGKGGYGNPFFLSTTNRSPKFATRGSPGEEVRLLLDLKSVGDVGMVGFPNAGKSTLLQALTGADGRNSGQVGGWEFTTLNPSMGIMRLDENNRLIGVGSGEISETAKRKRGFASAIEVADSQDTDTHFSGTAENDESESYRLKIADLPGLIEGASQDVGLGHAFLQHVERCSILIYVVDMSSPTMLPWEALRILANELEEYQSGLSARATLVVANKADLMGSKANIGRGTPLDDSAISSNKQTVVTRTTDEEARERLVELTKYVREEMFEAQLDAAARANVKAPSSPVQVVPISARHRQNVEQVARLLKEQHVALRTIA